MWPGRPTQPLDQCRVTLNQTVGRVCAPQQARGRSRSHFFDSLLDPQRSPELIHALLHRGVHAIGVPHLRAVSPGHLLVASIPIFEPSPDTGLAKSR